MKTFFIHSIIMKIGISLAFVRLNLSTQIFLIMDWFSIKSFLHYVGNIIPYFNIFFNNPLSWIKEGIISYNHSFLEALHTVIRFYHHIFFLFSISKFTHNYLLIEDNIKTWPYYSLYGNVGNKGQKICKWHLLPVT